MYYGADKVDAPPCSFSWVPVLMVMIMIMPRQLEG